MNVVDIIQKKRDGQALTQTEIEWFIREYTTGNIADYQASAWLMAVYLNGMTREETVQLTLAMAKSGHMMDLSDITDYAIDKHSSGGVGDKTSLVVLPLVAAFGVPIAKMSGRGLGFSGGTLDKLEAIEGFNVALSDEQFRKQAREVGIVLAGQTAQLAPADGKLYALRDVTATVPSMPLIASSIMSKKLAAGASGIVLDVKLGRGAFMPNLEAAQELARIMTEIGQDAGRDMVALLSDMNQPLGVAVGNALEVREALETLKGGGPADFVAHVLEVAGYMLKLAGRGDKWQSIDENRDLLRAKLQDGSAMDVFKKMVQAQGGNVAVVDDMSRLPQASIVHKIHAEHDGYLAEVRADDVAMASLALGAGRETKEASVDLAVGLEVHVNVGDKVQVGDTLMTIHANSQATLEEALKHTQEAVQYSDIPVEPLPLFYGVLER
jgi:pyrimidine-nucleoside phosphorylase